MVSCHHADFMFMKHLYIYTFIHFIYTASKPKTTPGCRKMFLLFWVTVLGLSSFRLRQINPDDLAGANYAAWLGFSRKRFSCGNLQKLMTEVKEPFPCQTPVRISWHGCVHFTTELGLYLFCLLSVCTLKHPFKLLNVGDSWGIQLFL